MTDLQSSIESAFKDTLKYNINAEISTGNAIIDTVLRICLLSVLSAMIGKLLYFMTDFSFFSLHGSSLFHRIYVWYKNPKRIVITGTRYLEMRHLYTRFEFSMRFSALVSLIMKSLEDRKRNRKLVGKLREFMIRENVEWYGDKRTTSVDTNFIVDQDKYFELSDDIYSTITMTTSSDKDRSRDDSRKNVEMTKEEYCIELWSYRKTCAELLQFVENVTDAYEKEKKSIADKSRYIFKYDGKRKDDDSRSTVGWKVFEFSSVRSLDQVFFEDKEKVVAFLERFQKERQFYDMVGKPWQLGILLEGEPGCGKTSFITALANYFHRSIKDCQFNRMNTVDDLEECIHCIRYDNKDMSMDKVIMVAEDFDCMTNIAKSRKLQEKEDADQSKFAQRRSMAFNDEHALRSNLYAIRSDLDEITPMILPKQATHNPNKITLSSLLNILDGIHSLPGRIIIFTTNCPDTLDEAFLRPGRIDLRIRFGRPTKRVMYDMMSYWYQCVDKMYIDKHTHDAFLKKWAEYEERIIEKKYRPCDIMNMMQIHGEDYDAIFDKLCSAE